MSGGRDQPIDKFEIRQGIGRQDHSDTLMGSRSLAGWVFRVGAERTEDPRTGSPIHDRLLLEIRRGSLPLRLGWPHGQNRQRFWKTSKVIQHQLTVEWWT